MRKSKEPLPASTRRVLTARANGDMLRNGQGADATPAQARHILPQHGYVEMP
jgi:hypothetical protein